LDKTQTSSIICSHQKLQIDFVGLKHETHGKSSLFFCCILSIKKTLGKACGAIAPHRPNVDPSLLRRKSNEQILFVETQEGFADHLYLVF